MMAAAHTAAVMIFGQAMAARMIVIEWVVSGGLEFHGWGFVCVFGDIGEGCEGVLGFCAFVFLASVLGVSVSDG